jgi:protein-S-isoprenylcysteine O-methyltransferase Ste14
MVLSFLAILLAAGAWGAVHSLLASLTVKDRVVPRLGRQGNHLYRLLFVLFAAVSLVPVLILVKLLPDAPLYSVPSPWRLVMISLQALAALGFLAALLQTGIMSFVGLAPLFRGLPERDPAHLITHGLYRQVRHPLYSCGLVILWLVPSMSWNQLALSLALTVYLLIGAQLEERKLLKEFGIAYAEYQRNTPMFVPRWK